MRALQAIVVSAAAVLVSSMEAGAACDAKSADHLVALIELYTSEGCDSCPPADNWLSRIPGADGSQVIPIAFHVDYWDRLGWTDRFANASYTRRQYEQMHRQRAAFVYTPQVMVQGRDFTQWHSGGEPAAAIAAINSRRPRATIELSAEQRGANALVDVHVKVPDAGDRGHALVAIALVQSKLSSQVRAGENAGKRLAHDHVVREWHEGLPVDASGELRQRLQFVLPADAGPFEIVAFAEDGVGGDVLQALSLPLCARP
jgi:hypothetical protein